MKKVLYALLVCSLFVGAVGFVYPQPNSVSVALGKNYVFEDFIKIRNDCTKVYSSSQYVKPVPEILQPIEGAKELLVTLNVAVPDSFVNESFDFEIRLVPCGSSGGGIIISNPDKRSITVNIISEEEVQEFNEVRVEQGDEPVTMDEYVEIVEAENRQESFTILELDNLLFVVALLLVGGVAYYANEERKKEEKKLGAFNNE